MKKRWFSGIIIPVLCVILAGLLIWSLIYFNFHRIFVLTQNLGLGKDRGELVICSPKCYSVALEDIESDTRINIDQSLMLVNTSYTVSEDYVWNISEYKSTGVYMNTCMQASYASLSAAVTEQTGKKLYVSSDVRGREEQEELYEKDPTTATLPGASEHETGLCVDVYVAGAAGDSFLKSEAGRFVNSHAHEYGLIIRYPSYGEDKTGIRFEPWHIRYVGCAVAGYIYNDNLTLEEFVDGLEIGKFYSYGDYIFSRQDASLSLEIPQDAKNVTLSPDNTGYYILVAQM